MFHNSCIFRAVCLICYISRYLFGLVSSGSRAIYIILEINTYTLKTYIFYFNARVYNIVTTAFLFHVENTY